MDARRPRRGHTKYHCEPPKWRGTATSSILCSRDPRLSIREQLKAFENLRVTIPFAPVSPALCGLNVMEPTTNGAGSF
jgi:hypothetical protein